MRGIRRELLDPMDAICANRMANVSPCLVHTWCFPMVIVSNKAAFWKEHFMLTEQRQHLVLNSVIAWPYQKVKLQIHENLMSMLASISFSFIPFSDLFQKDELGTCFVSGDARGSAG